jgi:hypothetical protein
MRRFLLTFVTLPLACAAQAETLLSDVTGNWAAPANNGFFYRAVLTREGDFLRLRIHEGMDAGALPSEPAFDNPQIAYASALPGARDWLEVGPEGQLLLNSVAANEGYVYSERLRIHHMDDQITVMGYAAYNNGPDGAASVPDDPFTCWSASCYSCVSDVWDGMSAVDGQPFARITPPVEAINAATWTPDTIYELGLCPAPN